MTAYLKLAVDGVDWHADFESALIAALAKAATQYCGGNGTFRFVEHAPFDEATPPVELSDLDRKTHSLQRLPPKLSLIEVENGFAQFHDETNEFSDNFREYLKAYFAIVRQHSPGARAGYLFWWDGSCEDDPALVVNGYQSPDALLAAPPALRVLCLAPV